MKMWFWSGDRVKKFLSLIYRGNFKKSYRHLDRRIKELEQENYDLTKMNEELTKKNFGIDSQIANSEKDMRH